MLIAVLPLLLGGAGAAVYFSGLLDKVLGGGSEPAEASAEQLPRPSAPVLGAAPIFLDLPDIQTNLKSTGKRPNYVRLAVSLELNRIEDKAVIDQLQPRIVDSFQTYLRELGVDDLNGSAGSFRLREELLRRINVIVHPVRVKDVLLPVLIIQ